MEALLAVDRPLLFHTFVKLLFTTFLNCHYHSLWLRMLQVNYVAWEAVFSFVGLLLINSTEQTHTLLSKDYRFFLVRSSQKIMPVPVMALIKAHHTVFLVNRVHFQLPCDASLRTALNF